jgi:Raf kinase inhibitor-like YbhB/YbcL family protein
MAFLRNGEDKMKKLSFAFLFLAFLGFSVSYALSQDQKTGRFKIASPVVDRDIPRKYTCDGENVNPPLDFNNVPPQAKSLALVFDDLDAPRGTFVHWIMWNIDPGIGGLKENSVPIGAVQGMNDFKKHHYGGPCPPSRAHRYAFKVFALDTRLNLGPDSTRVDLQKASQGHVIAEAQIIGRYGRR